MAAILLIPVYEPKETLVGLLEEMHAQLACPIVVVNDGSGPEFEAIFDKIKQLPDILCIGYEQNRGKGFALKTGIKTIIHTFPQASGIVTADSDGQHAIADIKNLLRKTEQLSDNELLLGVRTFEPAQTPAKSYWGNKITSRLFYFISGTLIRDTQTGLRGCSLETAEALLSIDGNRFEYEMNVLLESRSLGFRLIEEPIATIYLNNNEQSHFRPLKDSWLIYRRMFAYLFAAMASAVLDFSIFLLLILMIGHSTDDLVLATITARILSGATNYYLNKYWVFHDRSKNSRTFWKYGLLFIAQLTLSSLGVTVVTKLITSAFFSKLLVDGALFVLSFLVQRSWVFAQSGREQVS